MGCPESRSQHMSYRRTFLFFVILLQEGRASSRIANIPEGFYGCRAHTFIRIGKSFDERRNCLRCIRKTFLEITYPKPLTHNGTEETARKGNRAGLQRRHNIRNCSLVSDVIDYWQQIKPLHKRTFAHHFCKFGTGEDRQIEDAVSSCNPCERGYFVLV